MNFKDLFFKLRNKQLNKNEFNNKIFNLIALVLVGIILVISSGFFKDTNTTQSVSEIVEDKSKNISNNVNDYNKSIENELKYKLEKIEGVGKVEVMIYFNSGEEQVPAFNINDSSSITNEEDTVGGKRKVEQNNNDKTVVITNENGESKPFIIKKYMPNVTGVLVVAEGVENRITELRIKRAVCTLFNLPEFKVNVYPMKK